MTKIKLQELSSLFTISNGHQLYKAKLTPPDPASPIAYVSRTHRRNGIDGLTGRLPGLEPSEAGLITVCLRSRNHSLSSFVQPLPFYTCFHVAILTPIKEMTLNEKLWWCKCIEMNRFRYNFGRQANRTLGSLLVPAEIPDFVANLELPKLELGSSLNMPISTKAWKPFPITSVFNILPGRRDVRRSFKAGQVPWVSGSAENNGISAYVDVEPEFSGGCITVASNGSVGEAFFQPDPFTASTDVLVLEPKFKMTVASALTLCTILRLEGKHYNYARKWTQDRMADTNLLLPTNQDGSFDFETLEQLALSSRFSPLIETEHQ